MRVTGNGYQDFMECNMYYLFFLHEVRYILLGWLARLDRVSIPIPSQNNTSYVYMCGIFSVYLPTFGWGLG